MTKQEVAAAITAEFPMVRILHDRDRFRDGRVGFGVELPGDVRTAWLVVDTPDGWDRLLGSVRRWLNDRIGEPADASTSGAA